MTGSRLWRGLALRLTVASALFALVAASVTIYALADGARKVTEDRMVEMLTWLMDADEKARCESAPQSWMLRPREDLTVYAYNGGTLASAHPQAPAFAPEIATALNGGAQRAARFYWVEPRGGAVALRVAPTGPCAVVYATWPAKALVRTRAIVAVGLTTLVVALVAGVFLVRPLTRRIARLAATASHIGRAAPSRPGEGTDPLGELTAAANHTPDELGDLAAALVRAHNRIRSDAGKLEARQKALEQHLADVAHDLRTPIASLQIAVEQLAPWMDDDDGNELLTQALADVVYLGELTDNLRLASQFRDDWSPPNRDVHVDLVEVIDTVVARHRLLARRRGITISRSLPGPSVLVAAEMVLAQRAIGNIVHNAVMYAGSISTPHAGGVGGEVRVDLELLPIAGGDGRARFRLVIRDDGPGVPPTELPRLGERTFRSDEARQRDPRGSGLGLAITHEICRRHGWSLSFAEEAPRGLRVTIEGFTRAA